MAPKTQDVTIENRDYQIGKLDAMTGSYIAMTIMTKVLPSFIPENELGILPKGRTDLSETEFRSIQMHCLAVCRRYEGPDKTVPMAVLTTDGRFALPDLMDDITAILGLTINTLIFNLKPFLDAGGLSSVIALVPDSVPLKVPAA